MMAMEPSADYAPVSKTDVSDDFGLHETDEETKAVSWAWMYTLCVANLGISGTWALEFAVTTPYFEKGLNAGKMLSHTVWIAGPLSGLIVAPLVGAMSDRCTSRYGRRRPFIVAGVIATIFGMITFSQAKEIAAVTANIFSLGERAQHWTAIGVAIVAFCILDLAVNTTMWPVRALQGDLVPHFQQQAVQSANQVMGSLGELGANFLVQAFDEPVAHIRLCFLIAAVFYLASVSVILVAGREMPLDEHDPVLKDTQQSFSLISYLRGLPGWMWRIGGTYALGFFALFCFMPYASTWVGSTVMQGDPTAPPSSDKARLFEQGISLYGRGNLIRAAVQTVYAATYPLFLRLLTPGQLLGTMFGAFSVLVLAFANTTSTNWAQVLIVTSAFPMATQFTLPVALTVEKAGEFTGRYLGALNCFAVIPQLIDTLYTGYVSQAFGEAAVMRIGGVWGLIATLSAFIVMRV